MRIGAIVGERRGQNMRKMAFFFRKMGFSFRKRKSTMQKKTKDVVEKTTIEKIWRNF